MVAGGIAFAGVVFLPQLLAVMPAPLLGALLMWLGVSLLIDWVIRPLRTLRRGEYANILVILAVSIVAGFPAGILTGLVAAVGLFVVEYSRVETARYIGDGRDYHGELMSDERREALLRHGAAIVVIKLTGFVFFGTSDRLVQRVAQRVGLAVPDPVRFVVMDFRRVTGINSSAVMSFARLRRLAEAGGFMVVLVGLGAAIRDRLALGGIDLGGGVFHVEADLDDALRWAAGRLMSRAPDAGPSPAGRTAVARFLGDDALAATMLPYLERDEFPAGARIIEQGATSDDIYFVEEGEGIVQLEPPGSAPVKLASFAGGTIAGEIAFYRGEPRSASVIARTPVAAWRLGRAALARIDAEHPAARRDLPRANGTGARGPAAERQPADPGAGGLAPMPREMMAARQCNTNGLKDRTFAQWREVVDTTVAGSSMKKFQASQQVSTMSG